MNKMKINENVPKKFDVVVIGEINADLILKGNVIPAFGQIEQIVKDADLTLGSSAVIFACGASKLGLKVAFIGKVGSDLFGGFMVKSVKERDIDISGIIVDPKIGTGLSVILVNQNDRAILTFPGTIPELEYADIDFSLISQCRHLHLSGYFLLDKLRPDIPKLFKRVSEMGLSISMDTNYDPAEEWNGRLKESLPFIDVFLPNETEALAISGENRIEKALRRLSNCIPTIAIKRGEHGAITINKHSRMIEVDAVPLKVVDTVGAGDSFNAGFIYGYLNYWTLEKTLELAVACGSLSTRFAGGTPGQASLEEAFDIMKEHYPKTVESH